MSERGGGQEKGGVERRVCERKKEEGREGERHTELEPREQVQTAEAERFHG